MSYKDVNESSIFSGDKGVFYSEYGIRINLQLMSLEYTVSSKDSVVIYPVDFSLYSVYVPENLFSSNELIAERFFEMLYIISAFIAMSNSVYIYSSKKYLV